MLTAAVPIQVAQAKPKSESLSEAESVAETAARRFKEGDFELAAKLFDRAYELAKKPTLLFNAGRAYEQAGQREEALARYEAYAQVETDPGGREEAKLRAARLRDQLAKEGKGTQPAPGAADSAKTEPAKTEPVKTEPVKTEPAKTEPAKTEPAKIEPAKAEPAKKVEPSKEVAPPSRTGPWIAVGTSAVVAAAGAVVWGLAIKADHTLQSAVDAKNAAGQTTGITQVNAFSDRDGINKRKATGVALMSVGGAALVGSVAWLVLAGAPKSTSWLVTPAPDGLALVGRF